MDEKDIALIKSKMIYMPNCVQRIIWSVESIEKKQFYQKELSDLEKSLDALDMHLRELKSVLHKNYEF